MKKWKSNLILKIAAIVFFAVCLTVAGLSLLGVVFGLDQGVNRGVTDPYETGVVQTMARWFGQDDIVEDYAEGYRTLEELSERSASGSCNFVFALYQKNEDGSETLLASTFDTVPSRLVCEFEEYDEQTEFRVEVGVKLDLPYHYDSLYHWVRLFQMVETYWNLLLAALAASVLLGVADFVVLCCMAGHRKGREEIVLNWADRIPFDLYAAVLLVAAITLLAMCFEFAFGTLDLFANVLGMAGVLAAAMLVLAIALSFVTRVKAGKWWRNTVVCRVWSWALGLCRVAKGLALRVFRAIPLAWRSCLVTAGVLFALLLTGVLVGESGAFLLLYALISLCVLAAAALAVFQLRQLEKGGEALAAGDFETKIDTKRMFWDFKRHAEHLNAVGDGMAVAVEQRMKSERLKTELITNVSHDIKTPLTSIINYIGLLQKPHTREEEAQYLEVLDRQSARLKKLTEDLIEASKASTGNLAVNRVPTNVAEALDQALAEYQERLEKGELHAVRSYASRDTVILADGRLLWRVLDNLLSNVCKYALPGTRVYLTTETAGGRVKLAVKNISREPLNISASELMERFVRGDTARSGEGSGLGLNIAKSLVELQKGTLTLTVDGDLFKAELDFPQLQEN